MTWMKLREHSINIRIGILLRKTKKLWWVRT